MPQPSTLYDTLMPLFQPAPWRDRRHLTTLVWMVTGLLTSGWIALDEWAPGVAGRATYAQSTVRRFRRWLSNPRIDALRLYAALLRQALGGCPDQRWVVALDTTVLWNTFCVVQVALVWRGRAVPVAWKVLRHPSASVAFRDYRGVLGFAARLLNGREVVLLADRGFIHIDWLRWAKAVGWHYRIRGKRDIGLFLAGGQPLTLRLSAGELRFYAGVFLGAARLPVELAVGWEKGAKEPWIIVTDQTAGRDTLRDYGLRFTIEIYQPYNLCKTHSMISEWRRARTRSGRRFALPATVPARPHRPE